MTAARLLRLSITLDRARREADASNRTADYYAGLPHRQDIAEQHRFRALNWSGIADETQAAIEAGRK